MANVLLLTNIYPNNDSAYGGTKVCHSFTQEWVKLGYNVKVVHFDSLFPSPYYWIGKLFNKRIQAKTGCVAYYKTPKKIIEYTVDKVPVIFAPLKKMIPHKSPSRKVVEKVFTQVCDILEREKFVPNVVTGHFVLPQLEMIHYFKKKYPNIKTCLVLHGDGSQIPTIYPNAYKDYMASVDIWGFRSKAFKNQFEHVFGMQKKEFLCYSGVPSKYIQPIDRHFNGGIKHFAFLGSLFKLKNVDITIHALHQAFPGKDFTFDVIGDGAELDNLKKLSHDLGLNEQVVFHGKKSRDEAQALLSRAECFVMVSSREAFGLVYIEAMAKGCITIATEGQGIDGVIEDGENGFLCKSRDIDGLARTIIKIHSLDKSVLEVISKKAVETASTLTDKNVAETYIETIIS